MTERCTLGNWRLLLAVCSVGVVAGCAGTLHVSEPRAICSMLDTTAARYAALVGSVEREISLLREYRTRLVSDVVTGKLDVREAAAGLPEEADGAEELDEGEFLNEDNGVTDKDLEDAPEEDEV